MNIFISWSGQKSAAVASALHSWLPDIFQRVAPFISESDIEAGTRWQTSIAERLDDTDFGIVCVTRDNQSAPWLLFESGALAKSLASSRVVPLAVDLEPAEIQMPLGQFQGVSLSKAGVEQIVRSVNAALPDEDQVQSDRLSKAFETWWPQLEATLQDLPEDTDSRSAVRSDRDILSEVLNTVRSLARQADETAHERQSRIARGREEALVRRMIDSLEDVNLSPDEVDHLARALVRVGGSVTELLPSAEVSHTADGLIRVSVPSSGRPPDAESVIDLLRRKAADLGVRLEIVED